MAIAKDYSKEVLKHLSAIPIWEPGYLVKPGAIGRIRDGVFYEEGSLKDLWAEAPLGVEPQGGRDERYFASSEVSLAKAAVAGGIPNAPAKVDAKIKFERKGACVLHATRLTVAGLAELRSVLAFMDRNKEAFEDLTVVSHVEVADRFRIFCAESDDWEIGIAGDLSAVEALKIADASVSIASSSGAGYQASGSGPLIVRLYGVRRRWFRDPTIEPLEAKHGMKAVPEKPAVREIDSEELLG